MLEMLDKSKLATRVWSFIVGTHRKYYIYIYFTLYRLNGLLSSRSHNDNRTREKCTVIGDRGLKIMLQISEITYLQVQVKGGEGDVPGGGEWWWWLVEWCGSETNSETPEIDRRCIVWLVNDTDTVALDACWVCHGHCYLWYPPRW